MILAFDTSLPLMSVALLGPEGTAGTVVLRARDSRNEKLLSTIDWLLGETGSTRTEISRIVVTRGPGSFTGVRIGLATAQGLGIALSIPVYATGTLEAAASGVAADRVVVHSDAGRGERYVAIYERGEEIQAPALAAQAPEDDGFILDLDREIERLNVALDAAMMTQGRDELDLDRYRDLTPLYVRLPEAEVRLQQRNAE